MATRREFLSASAVGATIAVGGMWLWTKLEDRLKPIARLDRAVFPGTAVNLREVLATFFDGADLAAVALIGTVYLQRFVDSPQAMVEDLADPVDRIASLDDPHQALEVLNRLVLDDFDVVRLVDVDGWQLSVTESRLCGLAHQLLA